MKIIRKGDVDVLIPENGDIIHDGKIIPKEEYVDTDPFLTYGKNELQSEQNTIRLIEIFS